jgi:peptidoglycan/LPS O-acetylase OafA/YrhL
MVGGADGRRLTSRTRSRGEGAQVARPGGRILELDILRGAAILLVLGIHSPGDEQGQSGVLRPLDVVMHRIGWTGVDLFFVLSGFLIGGLLFNEIQKHGQLNVGRFLMRRMLRIWPAYYCLLVVAFIRLSIESHGHFWSAFTALWPGLVHIQNYIVVPRSQLWSLAIEEHFYLLLPLLLSLLLRGKGAASRLRLIPRLCVGLVIGCFALRTILVLTTTLNVRYQTYLCMDALFFGVTLAYLRTHRPEVLERLAAVRGLLVVSCALFVPAIIGGTIKDIIGYTCLYLGFALVLIRFMYPAHRGAILNRWINSRSARLMAWIGTYSYAIYLWHFDTGWWGYVYSQRAARALGLPEVLVWVCHTAAWFVVSIVAGALLGRLIEVPVMRARERLFPPSVAVERPEFASPAGTAMPRVADPDPA